MISKVNNSPSFGMAFRQDKVITALQPMKEKTLQAYSAAAGNIDKLSEDKGVDVFLKGIEEVAERAAEDTADTPAAERVINGFKLTIQGKGENPITTAFDIDSDKMPGTKRQVNKFFNDMKKDIGKIGILSEIKGKFGI